MNRQKLFNLFILFLLVLLFSKQSFSATVNAGEVGEAFCGDSYDPRDSLIGSTLTLCIPGILENVNDWQQIKCEHVVCSYTSISNGLPTNHCDEQRSYRICSEVMGEIFQLPFLNVIDTLKDKVGQIFANPVGVAYGVAVTIARENIKNCAGNCESYAITGQTFFVGFTDIAAGVQRLQAIFDQGFETPRGPDFCAQIEDLGIRDELNQILELD